MLWVKSAVSAAGQRLPGYLLGIRVHFCRRYFRATHRRAATLRAAVDLGGFSNSLSTRLLSRSLSTVRSVWSMAGAISTERAAILCHLSPEGRGRAKRG